MDDSLFLRDRQVTRLNRDVTHLFSIYRHPFFQASWKNIMVKPMNVKNLTFFPAIS